MDLVDTWLDSSPKKAHNKFKKLYSKSNGQSPRALFGMATALNKLALKMAKKSEKFQQQLPEENKNVQISSAPSSYSKNNDTKTLEDFHLEASNLQRKAADRFCQVLSLNNVPLFLFLTSGRTCLEIRRHRKEKEELIKALILMKAKFPNALDYASELAMEYLKRRQYRKAVNEYEMIINRWPNKALKEKVMLGLVLHLTKKDKEVDDRHHETIEKLFDKSITSSNMADISKTFKTLSESYYGLGFQKEAQIVNKLGAELGLFMSKWQKGFYDYNFYFPDLTAKPTWEINELDDVGVALKVL